MSSCCSFCNEGISLVQCNVCGAGSVYTWYYIVYTYLYKNIITAKINTPNIQQIGIIRWSSGQRFVYQQQQNDFNQGRKLLLRNLRNKKESLITSRWSSLPICARIHAKSSDEPLYLVPTLGSFINRLDLFLLRTSYTPHLALGWEL